MVQDESALLRAQGRSSMMFVLALPMKALRLVRTARTIEVSMVGSARVLNMAQAVLGGRPLKCVIGGLLCVGILPQRQKALAMEEPPNQSSNTAVPDVLVQAFLGREKCQTSHLVFQIIMDNMARGGRWEHIWEEKRVGKDLYCVYRGNRDGIVRHDEIGRAEFKARCCAPASYLDLSDATQHYSWIEGAELAGLAPKRNYSKLNGLSTGLTSAWLADDSPSEALAYVRSSVPKDAVWRVERNKEFVIVIADAKPAEGRKKPERWEWQLDLARDNEVVKTVYETLEPEGPPRYFNRTQTTYMRVDNRWWPQYSKTEQNGMSWTVEYLSAEFDRPEHPRKLTLGEMGWPVGMRVISREMGWKPGEERRWTGSEIVTEEEFCAKGYDDSPWRDMEARERASGYRSYPAWWSDETGRLGLKDVETKPSKWEDYVRRWCLRNSADDRQRQAAHGILKNCQDRAVTILQRGRPELDKIEALLANKSADPKQVQEARLSRDKLLKPVEELFTELKSRLDPLLRTGQDKPADTLPKPPSGTYRPAPTPSR